jgi:hypothetical protein
LRVRRAFVLPQRYIRAVTRFLVSALVAGVVACSGPAKDVKQTGHATGSGQSAGSAAGGTAKSTGGTGSAAVAVAPDVGCLVTSCVYHAGTSMYLTCLAGGSGTCFHFGAPCAPQDHCMYDGGDKTYKQCSQSSEGTCQQWGTACAPAKACMFSPADGLHHTCDEVAGGTCKKYGALCAP